MTEILLLTLLFLPFVQAFMMLVYPEAMRRYLGLFSTISSLVCLSIVIYFSLSVVPHSPIYLKYLWFPKGFVNFSLFVDGLSLFFALLITAMGSLVFYYSHHFMSSSDKNSHLFYCYMNLFMGAMLGAVLASNLILLFMFWEITGVASYLLISYHYKKPAAKNSSRLTFLLTSAASLCLLLGIVIVAVLNQTLELTEVTKKGIIQNTSSYWFLGVMLLMLIGVFAKSAQFPFQFWLPEAMTAPTPVSAYLHSATMVKLGIYFLARTYTLFVDSAFWFPLLTLFSLTTVLIGGFWALFALSLKRILAYATICQLGFFISFYGIGDPDGLQYDYIHIFNHALYKGSLFMLVGILAKIGSISEIHHLTKLYKKLPFISVIFAISIAAMAGVPGTTGFLSKELLVKDLVLLFDLKWTNMLVIGTLLLGLILKIAFSFRLFYFLFLEKEHLPVSIEKKSSFHILIPPCLLSLASLILGIWPKGLENLYQMYTIEGLHKQSLQEIDLWHGFSITLTLSLCLFIVGIFLFFLVKHYNTLYKRFEKFGFKVYWNSFLNELPHFSSKITSLIHSRDPQKNLRWPFVLFLLSTGTAVILNSKFFNFTCAISKEFMIEILLTICALMTLLTHQLLTRLIYLSLIGFFITYYYVLKEATDLAITQMVVEVATLFVFVLLLFQPTYENKPKFNINRFSLSLFSGIAVGLLPFFNESINQGDLLGLFYIKNTVPYAFGANAVNTILVDFRGLDTLGEITVIAIVALGIHSIFSSNKNSHRIEHAPWIETPLMRYIIPPISAIALLFSLYLLIRGHNLPGGGFSGGMTLAIVTIVAVMCLGKGAFKFLNMSAALNLMILGFMLSLTSTILPLFLSKGFMESYFFEKSALLNTPFLFDSGIFLLVLGAVTSILFLMRTNTVGKIQ